MELSEERRTRNEAVFRDANESIRDSERRLDPPLEAVPYLCECDDPGCHELVPLSAAEYEAVRHHGRHFLLLPGHENDNPVVETHADYVVVEKTGRAGEIAEGTDPRDAAP